MARVRGVAAVNAAKTQCVNGHDLSGDNVFIDANGKRACRICDRERGASWRERQGGLRLGRCVHGEEHGLHKLTEDDVREIRASDLTQRELAALFGVSKASIGYVKRRETWKHIS